MQARTFQAIIMALIVAPCSGVSDSNDVGGLTAWTLAGDGMQELRVGWEGLLPGIEFAAAGLHRDTPDGAEQEWPVRGYAIAHALSADMLATVLKTDLALPAGQLYGGLFAEYTYDRENEWSGGYVVGGLLAVPSTAWQTVIEYQSTVWNSTDNDYQLIAGLRRRF